MDPSVGGPPGVSQSSPGAAPSTGPQLGAAPGSAGDGASPGVSTAAGEAGQPPAAAVVALQAPEPGAAVPEVANSVLTLREEIEQGNIPTPGLFDWGTWQLWASRTLLARPVSGVRPVLRLSRPRAEKRARKSKKKQIFRLFWGPDSGPTFNYHSTQRDGNWAQNPAPIRENQRAQVL